MLSLLSSQLSTVLHTPNYELQHIYKSELRKIKSQGSPNDPGGRLNTWWGEKIRRFITAEI